MYYTKSKLKPLENLPSRNKKPLSEVETLRIKKQDLEEKMSEAIRHCAVSKAMLNAQAENYSRRKAMVEAYSAELNRVTWKLEKAIAR